MSTEDFTRSLINYLSLDFIKNAKLHMDLNAELPINFNFQF